MYEMAQSEERLQLYNMCYPTAPTIRSIVKTVAEVTHVNSHWPVVPGSVLKGAARILKALGLSNGSGIHPERVEKLMRSTNISGEKLEKSPYALRYDLHQAIEDWYSECNKEGLF